jgi:hypothetical protein
MDKLNNLHVPTFFVALVTVILAQFALTMNGQVVDPTTNEGRGVILTAVLGVVLKFIQTYSSK